MRRALLHGHQQYQQVRVASGVQRNPGWFFCLNWQRLAGSQDKIKSGEAFSFRRGEQGELLGDLAWCFEERIHRNKQIVLAAIMLREWVWGYATIEMIYGI